MARRADAGAGGALVAGLRARLRGHDAGRAEDLLVGTLADAAHRRLSLADRAAAIRARRLDVDDDLLEVEGPGLDLGRARLALRRGGELERVALHRACETLRAGHHVVHEVERVLEDVADELRDGDAPLL